MAYHASQSFAVLQQQQVLQHICNDVWREISISRDINFCSGKPIEIVFWLFVSRQF
jgi:hypothetical protein